MQRGGTGSSSAAPQVILLLFLGSLVCVWARQLSDNYQRMRLLYEYPGPGYLKRLPSYDFGLGKRSFEETSYEDQLSPLDAVLEKEQQQGGLILPYAPGKRTRVYGFGLGKRLTDSDWKPASSSASGFFPTYRQERRSKIYSFGLGKRQSHDAIEDYDGNISPPTAERRGSPQQRQFAFGLGKRDGNANAKE